MRRKIGKDKSGQYCTDKGWKRGPIVDLSGDVYNGKIEAGEKRVQHRFYLGRDVHEAKKREGNLAFWWDGAVSGSFYSDRGWIDADAWCWEPWSLSLAKHLAKGVIRDFVLPSMPDWFDGNWLGYLEERLAFFGIDSTLPDYYVMPRSVEKKKRLTFKERRMAVLSDRFNVSQWIRDYKQANPNATNTDIINAGREIRLNVYYQQVGNALKALRKGAPCPFCGRVVATKRGKFVPHKTSPLGVSWQSDPLCDGSRTLAPPNAGEEVTQARK